MSRRQRTLTPRNRGNPPVSSYDLNWVYEPRLVAEHLGRAKYAAASTAVGELIANALDAGATRVEIETSANPLGGLAGIEVSDNGRGMSREDLKQRFAVIGVSPNAAGASARLGRFGVGRFAVHRLGTISEWTTVAEGAHGTRVQSTFTLRSDDRSSPRVEVRSVAPATPTGTTIKIFNALDQEFEAAFVARLRSDLLSQFCSYLLGNPRHVIAVHGEPLDVASIVESRELQELQGISRVDVPVRLHHLLLHRPLDESRVAGRVLFTGKGRTVHRCLADDVASSNYLGIVESTYLDSIVSANREGVVELDTGFAQLKDAALAEVAHFAERVREGRKSTFLERAREQAFYPFRVPSANAVVEAKKAIFDVVLERMNEHANVEGMTMKQQAVIFSLLNRSLDNEDLLDILHEVAKLSDEDMEKFRRVLERTTLQSLIRLSSEVTARLEFLDILHSLVYGDAAGSLKERSQLHKILEPNCWIFGPAYHLATSDKNFRTVIRRHREEAGLPDIPEAELKTATGLGDIPDLFLAAKREYPTVPSNRHLLVELKAPSVPLGWKELQQAARYAQTVMASPQFDKAMTAWDVFLVSSDIKPEIDLQRRQKNKEPGLVSEYENATVWVLSWGEIIDRARSEMRLVRDHLDQKSRELSVSEYLQKNFPEVLEQASTPRGAKGQG
ncbi:MAG: ATP-binding protein [Deltaproteobacteria bacterium]|nr:ATP-binding protein [Deltaproteobacteria bacterium]